MIMETINLSVNPKILSHELRTPLTNILNLATELSTQKQQLTQEQCTYIEEIYKQGNRLLQVFNDLLFNQYKKINTDALRVKREVVSAQPSNALPILVADDEKIIRIVNSRMIQNLGYQVDVA